jgi:hypothetical protein
MPVKRVSRRVSEQVFSLYVRSLHPELFTIYDEREIYRDGYSASFWIIGSSHVITFRAGARTLTEVLAEERQELPVQHRLASFRFAHNPQKAFRYDDGVAYDARFDVHACGPDEFLARVRDIRHAVLPDGVLRVFDGESAGGLPLLTAVGFVPRQRSLNVRTFHTFPEDLTIIETHSRWEVRRPE